MINVIKHYKFHTIVSHMNRIKRQILCNCCVADILGPQRDARLHRTHSVTSLLGLIRNLVFNDYSLENIVHRCYKLRNRPTVLKYCTECMTKFSDCIYASHRLVCDRTIISLHWPACDTLIDCYVITKATCDTLLSIRRVFGSRLHNLTDILVCVIQCTARR